MNAINILLMEIDTSVYVLRHDDLHGTSSLKVRGSRYADSVNGDEFERDRAIDRERDECVPVHMHIPFTSIARGSFQREPSNSSVNCPL